MDGKEQLQLAALLKSVADLLRELRRERKRMRELHDDDDDDQEDS